MSEIHSSEISLLNKWMSLLTEKTSTQEGENLLHKT